MPHHVVLATAGYDHAIRFWEATTGICYRTLQYADSQVNRLEITPEKSLLAAAGNPHVRMFDINSSNPHALYSYDGHTGNVTAVGFHMTGNWMYTGSEDGTVKIWDIRAPGCQREYVGRAAVNSVCLHPNQTELISGDQNGNVRVWDLTANACSCELVPEGGTAIRSVSAASDGSMVVAANNNGTCYVWRLLSASVPCSTPSVTRQRKEQEREEMMSMVENNQEGQPHFVDEREVTTENQDLVEQQQAEKQEVVQELACEAITDSQKYADADNGNENGVAYGNENLNPEFLYNENEDESFDTSTYDNNTFHENDGDQQEERAEQDKIIVSQYQDPPETEPEHHLSIEHMEQQQQTTTMFEPLHKLQAHDGYILKCLISPDVSFLATTSSDHTVKLWSLDGFQLLQTLRGHQRWVWDVVSSVDAAYLVTASSDTQARLWDVSTGEAIRIYSGHQKACSCCALNDSSG